MFLYKNTARSASERAASSHCSFLLPLVRLICPDDGRVRAHERSEIFTTERTDDIPSLPKAEDTDRNVLLAAVGEGRAVHHLQTLGVNFSERDALVKPRRIPEAARILVIHPLGIRGLEDDIRADLESPQGGGTVRAVPRVTATRRQNHEALPLKMHHRPTLDPRFTGTLNGERRHDTGIYLQVFERVLERNAVDDGGQHPHVVRRHGTDSERLRIIAAEDITPAKHDRDLDTPVVPSHLSDLPRVPVEPLMSNDFVAAGNGQRLPRKLQQYTLIQTFFL